MGGLAQHGANLAPPSQGQVVPQEDVVPDDPVDIPLLDADVYIKDPRHEQRIVVTVPPGQQWPP